MLSNSVTLVIPTRNRPAQLAQLLGLIRQVTATCRVVVGDSSNPEAMKSTVDCCHALGVDHVGYAPEISFYEKMADLLERIETPLVSLLPDDDVPVLETIDRTVKLLESHPEIQAAQGYVVKYARHEDLVDIHAVANFVPGATGETAAQRAYQLLGRYQPMFWATFRIAALRNAIGLARRSSRTVFQEVATMVAIALQGRTARLRDVHLLRSNAVTFYRLAETDPFRALLEEPGQTMAEYRVYRDAMVSFMARHAPEPGIAEGVSVERFLDILHLTGLQHCLDRGTLHFLSQGLFAQTEPEIPVHPEWTWTAIGADDWVHPSSRHETLSYLWRCSVREAEPRDEIAIGPSQMADVERAFEHYF